MVLLAMTTVQVGGCMVDVLKLLDELVLLHLVNTNYFYTHKGFSVNTMGLLMAVQ